MKKKRKSKLNKLALGGALIGGALFISVNLVNSYDQLTTHPALTDEAVDFYNLNFPNNPLSQQDKDLLIKGAIEEDTPPRWLNHFYDPVYNEGWIGYTTSKEWAMNSYTQQSFTDSAFDYAGFANLFSDGLSPTDYSYERTLYDYAVGNRKRAMLAMGHVMHLLEDSNVPEHTRGDTHLPWHGTESPYEKTMAKWNPSETDIASGLFRKNKKPVLLNQLGDYFDEIARYSNGYFFSQDTIGSIKYPNPKILRIETRNINGRNLDFAIGVDRNKSEFILAQVHTRLLRNVIETKDATLMSEEINTLILDDYWSRLSTDFVMHGAGALKLFLDQAEKVKKEYANNPQVVKNPSLATQFLGFLGLSSSAQPTLIFSPEVISSIITESDGVADSSNGVKETLASSVRTATPLPTPLTPFATPLLTPTSSATPSPVILTVPVLPTETPVIIFWGVSRGTSDTPVPSANSGATGQAPPSQTVPPEVTPTPSTTPIPPSFVINDLSIDLAASSFGLVKLDWTAPSVPNNNASSSLEYSLRYASHSFDTIADWDNAATVASQDTPSIGNPGDPQSAIFRILDFNREYYFAIKTFDGGKWSDISNTPKYTIKPAVSDEATAFIGPSHPSISWQFQAPDAAWINQPAVAQDGTIFFGAPYKYNSGGMPRLYAIGQDGVEKWHKNQLAEPNWPITADDNSAYFGQVYPGFYVNGVNGDSTERWQLSIGYGIPGITIDRGGNILFTTNNTTDLVWKIKPDGTVKWFIPMPFSLGFTPVIGPNDDVFVGLFNSLPGLARLSAEDGSVIWQNRATDDGTGNHSTLDPVYDKESGKFYAGTTNGRIVTINSENGDINENLVAIGGRITTKAAVLTDVAVVGFDFSWLNPASGSVIYGVNKSDKAVNWSFRVDSPIQKQIAVDSDENLYFSTQSGFVYSLDKNGQERWVVDLGTASGVTSPALWDKAVFVGAGGKLFKLSD